MENDIPQEKGTVSKKSIVTNQTLMGWITIISLPLGVWGIYQSYTSNKEIKPVFKVLSDVIITEGQIDSKIKVYYDSVEVQNVRAVTVAIWNAGNEYLDKSAFSQDKPLSIRSTAPVRILEAKTVATTRSDLTFVPAYHQVKSTVLSKDKTPCFYNYLTLQIKGDEGLEANDGATFLLLYTSKDKVNWHVDARIKGAPKGILPTVEPISKFGFYDVIVCLAMFYLPYTAYKVISKSGFTTWRVISLVISILIFFSVLWFVTRLAYQTITLPPLPDMLKK